jgi:signal transduction histidine kinase/CheY-like chemotaxis protein
VRNDRDILFASVAHDIRNALTAMISSVEVVRLNLQPRGSPIRRSLPPPSTSGRLPMPVRMPGKNPSMMTAPPRIVAPPTQAVSAKEEKNSTATSNTLLLQIPPRSPCSGRDEPGNGVQDFVETALLCGRTIKTLIDNMLDMFKLETTSKITLINSPNNMRDTAHEAVKICAVGASKKGVLLLCDVAPELPPLLSFDKPRVSQVFMNFLSNAIKFTDKGSVTLKVEWNDATELEHPSFLVLPAMREPRLLGSSASCESGDWDNAVLQEFPDERNEEEGSALSAKMDRYGTIPFRGLIHSARKPAPPLSKPSYSCRVESRMREQKKSGTVRITVSDTGIGMTPESQARLFTPYTQVHNQRSQGGTGLGLWIAKQIVDGMNGKIEVSSTLGKGTTFVITIAMSTCLEPNKVTEPSATEIHKVVAGTNCILFDPNKDICEAMQELLSNEEMQVKTTTDSQGLLDLYRPEMDIQFVVVDANADDIFLYLRAIRRFERQQSRAASTIICMAGGELSARDLQSMEDLGIAELLHKPVTSEMLLRAMFQARRQLVQDPVLPTVLLVDDDPTANQVHRNIISKQFRNVLTATTCLQVLEPVFL